MTETFPRATVESSIASACRLIAKLELPDNATDRAMRRRVDVIETEAAQRMATESPSDVLGWLRKRVQALAARREMRRLEDQLNQMRQAKLAEPQAERRRRRR